MMILIFLILFLSKTAILTLHLIQWKTFLTFLNQIITKNHNNIHNHHNKKHYNRNHHHIYRHHHYNNNSNNNILK